MRWVGDEYYHAVLSVLYVHTVRLEVDVDIGNPVSLSDIISLVINTDTGK